MASLATCLCNSYVDPDGLKAFVSCRLVALDKLPDIRPIGIGETCHRIISKAILSVLRQDVIDTAGVYQLCIGQRGGCESSIQALHCFC